MAERERERERGHTCDKETVCVRERDRGRTRAWKTTRQGERERENEIKRNREAEESEADVGTESTFTCQQKLTFQQTNTRTHLDRNVEATCVVVFEVGFDLGNQVLVVRASAVEPENGRLARSFGTGYSQLDPILNRRILGLASTPDVARFHFMLHQHGAGTVDDTHGASSSHFKRLVVRAILLCLLRHESHV